MAVPVNRQAFLLFPKLYGTDIALEVGGNIFPGIRARHGFRGGSVAAIPGAMIFRCMPCLGVNIGGHALLSPGFRACQRFPEEWQLV